MYGYGNGDPINNADPFGLSAVDLVSIAVTAAPAIQQVAAAAATTVAATVVAVRATLPFVAAGALNTLAGTSTGAALGYPNSVGVNSRNQVQPRDARGRWASPASNPGIGATVASNSAVQAAVGFVQGVSASQSGATMPGAVSEVQSKAQEVGAVGRSSL